MLIGYAAAVSGCASKGAPAAPTTVQATDHGPIQTVKPQDGSTEDELVGRLVPSSGFSKLRIGKRMPEVLAAIGGPDGMDSRETGKRRIAFDFGGDARQVEAFYKGKGCLTYTGGNAWGGGENRLIHITRTQRTRL